MTTSVGKVEQHFFNWRVKGDAWVHALWWQWTCVVGQQEKQFQF